MKDRKQHVVKMAHQLFIDKGFQATSIQDILDFSGISKGTFYNYFSSKNELLVELFKTIYKEMEKKRNELLIGQDPSNIEIFTKQIELYLEMNRVNNLSSLFEEVFFSNDEELKTFIKNGHFRIIQWLHNRFLEIFGPNKEPYLLDCAIMFLGILNHNYKYYSIEHSSHASLKKVVRYSVNRLVNIVEEVTESGEQLLPPEKLTSWLPNCKKNLRDFQQKLQLSILSLKKQLNHNNGTLKYLELLDFIYDELMNTKEPRKFLLESVLQVLKTDSSLFKASDIEQLELLLEHFFENQELL